MAPGEPILVCVAWPYANGHLHLGHMAGSLLPPDIFARYHRMKGDSVLMVSGSDCHGTPITVTAEKEGLTPAEVVAKYNAAHVKALRDFGVAFDLFTATTTDNHREVVQDIFLRLHGAGHLYKARQDALYCTTCSRFLPDRYVEGTCPHCGYEEARGDQCDQCGKTLEPTELLAPRCKHCGNATIEARETEHFFFRLSGFQERLKGYVADKGHWRANTINFTQNWLNEGLKDRPITRDLLWGVPIPLAGYESKRLYVWFEAVCGYLSASIEWAKSSGQPEAWKKWWEDPAARSYYFLGKDNIPFHTIIWPAILMGYSDTRSKRLNLPYDVPANEFLNLDGRQFSKSRGIGIWVPDILARFDPDVVRYYLSINMPEGRDSNWTWEDFVAKVNDELVDTFGNLAHRALTFTHKHFGTVPELSAPTQAEKDLHAEILRVTDAAGEALARCEFKRSLKEVMALANRGNEYFQSRAPWKLVKEDKAACGTVMAASLHLVRALALLLAPFVPFAADRLWAMLGEGGSVHAARWDDAKDPLPAGQKLREPKPLFAKLDLESIIGKKDAASAGAGGATAKGGTGAGTQKPATAKGAAANAKGGSNASVAPQAAADGKGAGKPAQEASAVETATESQVTIDDFAKLDIRIARIEKVEDHPKADKLYVLQLDVGPLGTRQIVSGIKESYKPEELEGKLIAVITNLKPAKLRGIESQGMLLAGETDGTVGILSPVLDLQPGSRVR